MTDADKLINALLENEDEDFDDAQEVAGAPEHTAGINGGLIDVLTRLKISADRIINRYSDTYIMCPTWQEASQIANAGPWKSMAEIVRTNPDHPDAKTWPWLVDIPFANLGGYIGSKIGESETEDFDDIDSDWKEIATPDFGGEVNVATAMTARNFWHKKLKNSDGRPLSVRRNGRTKTWKRQPDKFSVPVKYGLYKCFYIDNSNAADWSTVPPA